LEILRKITISHTNTEISGISSEFSKYTGHIPLENRDNYIGALLGRVLAKVKDPPHKWEVTKKDFESILQDTSPTYSKPGQRPLPTDFADAIVPEENVQELHSKKFPAVKVGKSWRFKLSEIDAWLRSGGAAE